jgi:Zn-dependent protease
MPYETRDQVPPPFPGPGPESPAPATAPQAPAGPQAPALDYYPPSYQPEPTERQTFLKRIGGTLAAIGILLVKLGAKLKLLLVALPKIKLFTTSASMLVSIAAYSLIWGWKFAAGFVVLILIHEMGHVLQLRREGIEASAPMFIPFLGAAVAMKKMPDDAAAEARVGLAGPVLGSLGCLIPLALYAATGAEIWKALAFSGFFINLFNLLPMLPLDGGRAMAALSPKMWIAGFLALLAFAIAFPNPIILIIVLLGGFETYRRWKGRGSAEAQAYYRVKPRTRAAIATVYIGLALALVVGMDLTHVARDFGDV